MDIVLDVFPQNIKILIHKLVLQLVLVLDIRMMLKEHVIHVFLHAQLVLEGLLLNVLLVKLVNIYFLEDVFQIQLNVPEVVLEMVHLCVNLVMNLVLSVLMEQILIVNLVNLDFI